MSILVFVSSKSVEWIVQGSSMKNEAWRTQDFPEAEIVATQNANPANSTPWILTNQSRIHSELNF
jgi:hypothetical protein